MPLIVYNWLLTSFSQVVDEDGFMRLDLVFSNCVEWTGVGIYFLHLSQCFD
jgi:hypothetical protein